MDFLCEVLSDAHDASRFDSGQPTLDEWLRDHAASSDARRITRTYVWHAGDAAVVGYYTLMPYLIRREVLSKKQGRGLPDAISCYLLARLALDGALQGQGLGSQLLASALLRVATGADELGGRFVVADAIDPQAAAFYEHHGFGRVPGHDNRLVLSVRSIQERLGL